MAPNLPRKAFDVVERPVSKVTESVLETDAFMDALSLAWKLRRSALRRVESGTAACLRVAGAPTRGDVTGLVNQVAGLQRELRELRRELDGR